MFNKEQLRWLEVQERKSITKEKYVMEWNPHCNNCDFQGTEKQIMKHCEKMNHKWSA